MTKRYLSLLLLLLIGCVASAQTSADAKQQAERLFERFKSAAKFDFNYPREKVYLHLDNSSYIEGDSIWYKAYVVRASSLQPTRLSGILYVDLLNADGSLIDRQIQRLDSLGQADGCLSLQLPVRAGYYEVRAYTREMTNWDQSAIFSRIIPVFTGKTPNKQLTRTADTGLMQLSLPLPVPHDKVTMVDQRPYTMQSAKRRRLSFFPEGGHRASGLSQQVAFELTDGTGLPSTDTIAIYNAADQLIEETCAEHLGMGSFVLPADFTEGYAVVRASAGNPSDNRFALPSPTSDYTLEAQADSTGISVLVSANEAASQRHTMLGLAVFSREEVCYFDTITPTLDPIELFVPARALRSGVSRIELFDASGISRASRLVWHVHADLARRRTQLSVQQNAATYAPFSPAVVQFHLTDHAGRPLRTPLSVAVRDVSGDITDPHDGGLEASLLLASEVKGYIARPDLYFAKNDAAHRRMIDLLLLVQGWEANDFSVLCGKDSFCLKQPIEDSLIVRGWVLKDNDKWEPLPNRNINFHAYSLQGSHIEGATTTNAKGYFAFRSLTDFTGTHFAQFTITNDEGKRKWCRLALDRWFAPKPRPLTATDLTLRLNIPISASADSALTATATTRPRPELFTWKDTLLSLNNVLATAEVTAKNKHRYHGFTGNRYTWNGGERYGMSIATKYINIEQCVEEAKDRGWSTDDAQQLLSRIMDDDYTYERNDVDLLANQANSSGAPLDSVPRLYYRGRAYATYLNNEGFGSEASGGNFSADRILPLHDLSLEQIKSMVIVTEGLATDAVSGEQKRISRTRDKMLFYERPDAFRYRTQKGVDRRILSGLTPKKQFYAPDYRGLDLPAATDLRRTLHWAPSLTTDAQGNASLLFFTNAREGQQLGITVRGLTQQGEWIEWDQ